MPHNTRLKDNFFARSLTHVEGTRLKDNFFARSLTHVEGANTQMHMFVQVNNSVRKLRTLGSARPKLSPLPILTTPPRNFGWSLLMLSAGRFLYVWVSANRIVPRIVQGMHARIRRGSFIIN